MILSAKNLLVVLAGTSALAMAAPAGNQGQVVQITSSSDWCMMMPPTPGGGIAENEHRGIAFCTKENSSAPGAKVFPKGFIQSAHYVTGKDYVQVTGMIDPAQYQMSMTDRGGQFDNKAPTGSACANYKYYVNLIEPNDNRYCIRCCNNKSDCNTGKSTHGCSVVVPGDYSGSGSVTPTGPTSSGSNTATGTSTASATVSGSVQPTGTATVTGTASVATTTSSSTKTDMVTPTQTTSDAATTKKTLTLGAVLAFGMAILFA
ncbi:hypothetical protein BGW38_002747 [Lunasporangiospora selenospora]|uniref:Secreted protein n=1 Tax=Lunasporangiospora selenospora TaxID=979761 RepID=A0A9P6FRX0_9FUNG|nr:hypothetical protein BGW38_002747 [Lunasporangiospora selenospora]